MKIIKTTEYKRNYKKIIVNKHLNKEAEKIKKLEKMLLLANNFNEFLMGSLINSLLINKKQGNLKEIYTANLNKKIRLYMKPIGEYPYNLIEIEDIEFVKIDDKHYGEGYK